MKSPETGGLAPKRRDAIQFSDLSFVSAGADGSVNYWSVTPSEDYERNEELGRW